MTVTVAADVTLDALQLHLASIGQWLPIDGDPQTTLGDLVDRNSTGPLRLGFGGWRDLLLGLQARNGRGELISAGGRTVKNVAGYDVTKLLVGQRGALARLITLTTRTYLRPTGAIEVQLANTPQRLHDLLPTPLRPQWAVLTPMSLRIGYVGDEPTLAFIRRQWDAISASAVVCRSIDADIEARQSLWNFPAKTTFRAAVPPAAIEAFVAAAGCTEWAADAAFGVVVGPVTSPGDIAALKLGADRVRGSLLVIEGGNSVLARHPPPSTTEARLMERLKHSFGV